MVRLHIDSRYRTSGTVEKYSYQMVKAIKNVRSMSLVSVNIPKSITPVNDSYNGYVDWSQAEIGAGANQQIVIPNGNYTGTELAYLLETAIEDAFLDGTWFSLTYNSNTNRLEFDITSTTPMNGAALVFAAQATTPASAMMIGLLPGESFSIAAATGTTEFPAQVNMSWPNYLYLNIRFSGRNTKSTVTDISEYSFVVPYGNASWLDFTEFTANTNFPQNLGNPMIDFEVLDIEWICPGIADVEGIWSFDGIDHNFVIELNPGAD